MIAELLLGHIVTRAFEFRILDHQDQFSCRASNRYYSVALELPDDFPVARVVTGKSRPRPDGDIFKVSFRTRGWLARGTHPAQNMPYP